MPSLLVADSLGLKQFKVVNETFKSLLKKEQDVKIEFSNLLENINNFLAANTNSDQKDDILEKI